MQIIISGRRFDVTPPLRTYIEDKLSRLRRHYGRITGIHVVLGVDKTEQHAEATLQIDGGSCFAQAKSHDMYAAIDALADKLDRQLTKHKGKNHGHHDGDAGRHD